MNLSFDEIRSLLRVAINKGRAKTGEGLYPWDVYPDYAICRDESLSGEKFYRISYVIDENSVVTLGDPVEVNRKTTFEPVKLASFSLAEGVACGDHVEYSGVVFEAGEFPDKGISISEADIATMAEGFSPVPNQLEHTKTIFSVGNLAKKNMLGQLSSVIAQGKTLIGTVKVPAWLHEANNGEPFKVSLDLDRASKLIVGNSLVINPRIKTAQVAAFSDGDVLRMGPLPMDNLFTKFKAFMLGLKDSDFEAASAEPVTPPAITPPAVAPDATFAAGSALENAELNALKARIDAMGNIALSDTCAKFADSAILSGKAAPSERESLMSMYRAGAIADGSGVASFSESGQIIEGDCVKAIRASIEARPTSDLMKEKLGSISQFSVIGADPPAEGVSAARQSQLLDLTPTGKAILKEKQKQS